MLPLLLLRLQRALLYLLRLANGLLLLRLLSLQHLLLRRLHLLLCLHLLLRAQGLLLLDLLHLLDLCLGSPLLHFLLLSHGLLLLLLHLLRLLHLGLCGALLDFLLLPQRLLLELLRLLSLHRLCRGALLDLLLLPLGLLELLRLLGLDRLGGGTLLGFLLLALGLLELLRLHGLRCGALLHFLLLPLQILELLGLLRLLALDGLHRGTLLDFLLLALRLLELLLCLLHLPRLLELLLLPCLECGRREHGGGPAVCAVRSIAPQRNRRTHAHRNAHKAIGWDAHDVASCDGPAAEEVDGHDRDGAGRLRVRVAAAAAPSLVGRRAVGLVDVPLARVVTRPPGFAGGERKPSDAMAAARDQVRVPTGGAADEAHHCGGIDRTRVRPSGHPAPSRADTSPAPVVGRRKSPGRCVDPSPAPRRHVDPLAVAVGRPFGIHAARVPHVAVVRIVLPVAVGIELLVADHIARDVARRNRLVFDAVALGHPAIEFAAGAHGRTVGGCEVAARSRELLVCAERHGFAAFAVQRHIAGGDRDPRRAPARADGSK